MTPKERVKKAYIDYVLSMLVNESYDDIKINSSAKTIRISYYSDNNKEKRKERYHLHVEKSGKGLRLFVVDDDYRGYSSDTCFMVTIFKELTRPKSKCDSQKIYDIIMHLYEKEYMDNYIFNGIPSHHIRNTKLKTLMDEGNKGFFNRIYERLKK